MYGQTLHHNKQVRLSWHVWSDITSQQTGKAFMACMVRHYTMISISQQTGKVFMACTACPFTYCSTCFTWNKNHGRIIERTLHARKEPVASTV